MLADLATTVGAVLLARGPAGDPVSDEILAAAQATADEVAAYVR